MYSNGFDSLNANNVCDELISKYTGLYLPKHKPHTDPSLFKEPEGRTTAKTKEIQQ